MLFYYFNNKEELYSYLIEYCLDIAVRELIDRIDISQTDFIERLRQIAHVKAEFLLKYPNILDFMASLLLRDGSNIPESLEPRYMEILSLNKSKLYDNIDLSLFRDDIDTKKAFNLIRWSLEGYQNELQYVFRRDYSHAEFSKLNMAPYWEEFYEYLDALRTLFYK